MSRYRFVGFVTLCVVCSLAVVASAPGGAADVIPIGHVQGAVSDAESGPTHRSPFAPASGNSAGTTTVTVQGVITQMTLARTSAGLSNFGFFLENTAATADSDPNSSAGR